MIQFTNGSRILSIILIWIGITGISVAQETRLTVSVDELNRVSEAESSLRQLLDQEFDSANPLIQGRQAVTMSGRQAVMSGLEKNLTLQKGKLDDDIAAAVLEQARAVFDPVLVLSLGFDRTQVNTRIENAPRFQSATTVNDDGDNVLAIDEAFDPRAPVVVFSEARDAGFVDSRILASQEPITGADEELTLGAGVEQALPWGGTLQINYSAINNDTFFINNPQLFSGNANPSLNLIGFGSYKRPWVSQLVAGMTMPIPGTRGYGVHSDQTLNRNRAILGRESSANDTLALVNQTLLDVDNAWWNLVESALIVQVVRESRLAAEAFFDTTDRLFKARSANNYDLSQAELSLSTSRQREQQAWSAYVSASDALSNLLDKDAGDLIIPEGFGESLGLLETSPESADDAISNHPDYLSQNARAEVARLNSEAGQQGTRPDLSLDAELQMRQSNQVFGYESLGDSLGSVFDPDVTTIKLGVTYSRPLGNRGAEAASQEADAGYRQSRLNLQATSFELQNRLRSAEARLEGALLNAGYLAEASRLAEESYEKALSQQRNRQVREYELAGQHAQLLNARLSFISSLVAVKTARTALLDAQGILHTQYASNLATTPLERLRLARLEGTGSVGLFVPGGEK